MFRRCPFDGDAAVAIRPGGAPRWLRADPRVHVSPDLVTDPDAGPVLAERYAVGRACPVDPGVLHATLRPHAYPLAAAAARRNGGTPR